MSRRSDYDFDEWQDLTMLACVGILYKLPTTSSSGDLQMPNSVSAAIILVRELLALGSFLSRSLEKYGQYELLSELITCLKEKSSSINHGENPVSATDVNNMVVRVNAVLAEKADDQEAAAYRAFVYELAYEVANACGDGFLGMGERISADEAKFLQNLKALLLEK